MFSGHVGHVDAIFGIDEWSVADFGDDAAGVLTSANTARTAPINSSGGPLGAGGAGRTPLVAFWTCRMMMSFDAFTKGLARRERRLHCPAKPRKRAEGDENSTLFGRSDQPFQPYWRIVRTTFDLISSSNGRPLYSGHGYEAVDSAVWILAAYSYTIGMREEHKTDEFGLTHDGVFFDTRNGYSLSERSLSDNETADRFRPGHTCYSGAVQRAQGLCKKAGAVPARLQLSDAPLRTGFCTNSRTPEAERIRRAQILSVSAGHISGP